MKSLRLTLLVFFVYQPLFFNILSMENEEKDEIAEQNPLEKSFTKSKNIETTQEKNKLIKNESGNLNVDPSNLKTLRFHQQNIDDTRIYKGDCFIGELPPGSNHILESFENFSSIRNIFPILIKISGREFSGKTTLVRHFVQLIKCSKSQFLEIGSLNNIDKIKETLKSKGIELDQFPSEIETKKSELNEINKKKKKRKLEDIKVIIEAFYNQKAILREPYIINFTKGLGLTDVGLQKLRESIKTIQQDKIAPLTVFFESQSNGSSNCAFLDEIIHIYPPTPNDIMALLTYIFKKNGYEYESIKPEILSKLQPAATKKQYNPPQIMRIAEKILRYKANKGKDYTITNEDIEKVFKNKDPL